METKEIIMKAYWKKNLSLIATLIAIWFIASYGIVILLGGVLQNVNFFGTTLPFWFGQQGSILTFIALLVVYAVRMDKIGEEIRKICFMEEEKFEEETAIEKTA